MSLYKHLNIHQTSIYAPADIDQWNDNESAGNSFLQHLRKSKLLTTLKSES